MLTACIRLLRHSTERVASCFSSDLTSTHRSNGMQKEPRDMIFLKNISEPQVFAHFSQNRTLIDELTEQTRRDAVVFRVEEKALLERISGIEFETNRSF